LIDHSPIQRVPAGLLHVRPRLWLLLLPLLALLAAGCGGASRFMLNAYLEDNAQQLTIPASEEGTPVQFVVEPGTPAEVIGENLLAAGLIEDDLLFEAYVRVNGLATRLEAGTFNLAPSMTMIEIVDSLQNALARGVVVAVREGWRLEQTTDFLTATNIFSDTQAGFSPQAEIYENVGLTGNLTSVPGAETFTFVNERPAGASLEGYLFPDSYELDRDAPRAIDLIARQLEAFRTRVLPLYEEAIANGTTELSLHEVLTLASIVEREAVIPDERPTIAGVYLNRINTGMRLEADPTVQYAMGYQPAADVWWKTPVTLEEYSGVVSPYNTYLNAGLPPGPIAAPGLNSIQAVLNPEPHNYYFFVAVPDGTGAHVFAETFDEHIVNVQRYQSGSQ
jgi:UPF0755 protein